MKTRYCFIYSPSVAVVARTAVYKKAMPSFCFAKTRSSRICRTFWATHKASQSLRFKTAKTRCNLSRLNFWQKRRTQKIHYKVICCMQCKNQGECERLFFQQAEYPSQNTMCHRCIQNRTKAQIAVSKCKQK